MSKTMGISKKQWMMLAVIVTGTFITILNQTLVTPALPSIMHDTGVDAATGQWLTSGFTMVNAIMIPITAYLQDRFSIKSLFITSMSIFAVGTLLCGWAPVFAVLLAGRLIQAMGAGILMPMSMTVLLITFPVERRGFAMGIFGLVNAFAPMIGPTVSGFMVDILNWHIMFYIVLALVAMVIVLAVFLIGRCEHESEAGASLDPLSVILSTLGFGGMLYGFSVIGSTGFTIPTCAITVIGAICVAWFFVRQTHLEVPMLRVEVLKDRNFLVATIICMIVQAVMFAAPVLMPLYVQDLLGYSAIVSGLVIMPGAILMGVLNPIAGKIFDRRGPRAMSIVGLTLLFLTTLSFAFFTLSTSIIVVAVVFGLRMIGMVLVNMPVNTWGMNSLDTRLINHGTSINNTLRMVAGSLGTAIVVSIYTFVGTAYSPEVGEVNASMAGFNIGFAVCSLFVLAGLILAVVFVKGKTGTIAATGIEEESVKSASLLSRIMKRDVFVLREDDTVKDAMALFTDKGISGCPVIDSAGNAVGFISDGDILSALASRSGSYVDPVAMIAISAQSHSAYDRNLEGIINLPVSSIENHNLITVNVNDGIDEACRVLTKNHLKKVPVVDNDKLVGVVNRSDITRYSMEMYLENRPEDVPVCDRKDRDADDAGGGTCA